MFLLRLRKKAGKTTKDIWEKHEKNFISQANPKQTRTLRERNVPYQIENNNIKTHERIIW
jgi:hypothetical protein